MIEHEDAIDLDGLQYTAERLLSLLKERQKGLVSWNEALSERLNELCKLTSPLYASKPQHLRTCDRDPRDEEWTCDKNCPTRTKSKRICQ